jgi:hypothetical protein
MTTSPSPQTRTYIHSTRTETVMRNLIVATIALFAFSLGMAIFKELSIAMVLLGLSQLSLVGAFIAFGITRLQAKSKKALADSK